MKQITLLAGQGSENYGEKLTYKQTSKILKDRNIKIMIPYNLREAIKYITVSDGVIFSGRRIVGNLDSLDVIDMALEFEKPVFLFGVGLGEMKKTGLKRFSTSLMSPLLSGFLTDRSSTRWASFWAGSRVKVGTDLAHIYLLSHAKREKSKFAVFSPRNTGALRHYKEFKWLPHLDVRVIVANPSDSHAAVEVSHNVQADEVVILKEAEDVMSAISNAKFVLSERFHVSLTAESFGVPFVHIGRRARRYFEKGFSNNFSSPDEIDMALAFSKLKEKIPSYYTVFDGVVKSRFNEMLKGLESFLFLI